MSGRPTAAIVGCGSIAWAHAYGLAAAGTAELTAVADIQRGAVDRLGDAAGVPDAGRFTDYRQLLAEAKPDIVVVCLWHGLHADAVVAAAAAGARLVLCEKPMAGNLGEAQQMLAATRASGTKLAIAHQRRFYPGWSEARRLVAEGAIGRPTHARLEVRDGLLNSATHNVDLARFILGDPPARTVTAAVQRDTDRYERGLRVEDSALAMFELEGGTRVFLESDIAESGLISANAVVTGTDGILAVQENHVRLLNGGSSGWTTVSGVPFGTAATDPAPIHPLAQPLHRLIAHFGSAVIEEFAENFVRQARSLTDWLDGTITDDDHPGEARHGYAALELLMAVYESARCREVTRLPLRTRAHPLDAFVESGDLPVKRPGAYEIRPGALAPSN